MGLLDRTQLGARFKPGNSALGHRWLLLDADDQEIGRTKRAYGGGIVKRGLWRTVTATGLDKGDDIKATVFDGDEELANVWSQSDEKIVHLEVGGTELGSWHRDGDRVSLRAGDRELASIDATGDGPWPITEDDGDALGMLSPVQTPPPPTWKITDLLLYGEKIAFQASDFAATMHKGFRGSNEYWVRLNPDRTPPDPLRTLAILSPVLAGYAY